ncbi:MAG: O-antigen ligase family protein [Oscillospiraceae bacterium]|nr:O-antigen ligase family protein [Oscillospiraceae bacterium]
MLLFIALFAVIFFIGEKIFPDNPFHNNPLSEKKARCLLICTGIYFLFVLISGILSENKDVVLWGIHTEYEGMMAIFSYCIVFLTGYNYCGINEVRKFYKKAFFALILIVSLLALFEYIHTPLMELPFMKYIIAPAEYRDIMNNITSANDFRESVLMFYNSNYMGSFCTIIFPVSFYYVISAFTNKDIKKSIISFIVLLLVFIAVITSNSTASFYIAVFEASMLIFMFAIKKCIILKHKIVYGLISFALVMAVNFASGNEFIGTVIKSMRNSGTYQTTSNVFEIDEISVSENSVNFRSKDSEYQIKLPVNENEVMTISGINNTTFEKILMDKNIINITDINSGADINAFLSEGILYLDLGYKSTVDFAVTTSGVKAIVQNAKLIDKIPFSIFNGTKLSKFYSIATGRGYIWLNTLPILKDCIIKGKGAGNFPFYFIQNDIAGLFNAHGTYRLIIDKPHNWYLQIAVTAGIPALIAVLILFVMFFISGVKLFINASPEDFKKNSDNIFIICLFTGLFGFMLTGIVNDSIVSVNPFFWFNFGIAFYWLNNTKNRKKDKE